MIRKLLFLLLLICSSDWLGAQPTNEQWKRDPFWLSNNPKTVSRFVTKHCTTDEEKIRQIAFWIAKHVRYDTKFYQSGRLRHQTPKQTIRRRKAICNEYAELLVDLAKHAGIKATVVDGYAMGYGRFKNDLLYAPNHSWNLVILNDNKAVLIDPTLMSGEIFFKSYYLSEWIPYLFMGQLLTKSKMVFRTRFDSSYFCKPPEEFLRDHYPTLAIFQLLDPPITPQEYEFNLLNDSLQIPPSSPDIALLNKHLDNLDLAFHDATQAYSENCQDPIYKAERFLWLSINQANQSLNSGQYNLAELNMCKMYIDSAATIKDSCFRSLNEDVFYRIEKNNHLRNSANALIKASNDIELKLKRMSQGYGSFVKTRKMAKKKQKSINKRFKNLLELESTKIGETKPDQYEKAKAKALLNEQAVRLYLDTIRTINTALDSIIPVIQNIDIILLLQKSESILNLDIQRIGISQSLYLLRQNHFTHLDDVVKSFSSTRITFDTWVLGEYNQYTDLSLKYRLDNRQFAVEMNNMMKRLRQSTNLMKQNYRRGFVNDPLRDSLINLCEQGLQHTQVKLGLIIDYCKQSYPIHKRLYQRSRYHVALLKDEKGLEAHRAKFKNRMIQLDRKRNQKGLNYLFSQGGKTKRAIRKLNRK